MGIVRQRIQALGAALRDVVLVGSCREQVRFDNIRVTADALLNVRRHVNNVPRAWHERQQPIGLGFGTLGRVRRFPEMNP